METEKSAVPTDIGAIPLRRGILEDPNDERIQKRIDCLEIEWDSWLQRIKECHMTTRQESIQANLVRIELMMLKIFCLIPTESIEGSEEAEFDGLVLAKDEMTVFAAKEGIAALTEEVEFIRGT